VREIEHLAKEAQIKLQIIHSDLSQSKYMFWIYYIGIYYICPFNYSKCLLWIGPQTDRSLRRKVPEIGQLGATWSVLQVSQMVGNPDFPLWVSNATPSAGTPITGPTSRSVWSFSLLWLSIWRRVFWLPAKPWPKCWDVSLPYKGSISQYHVKLIHL